MKKKEKIYLIHVFLNHVGNKLQHNVFCAEHMINVLTEQLQLLQTIGQDILRPTNMQ